VRIQTLKETAPVEVDAYKNGYKSASSGNYDIYVVFVEKGLSLLNSEGRLGFILPHKFFNARYGAPLRQLIAEGNHLEHVVHFGHQQVFSGATTYTCLLFLSRKPLLRFTYYHVDDLEQWRSTGRSNGGEIENGKHTAERWSFAAGAHGDLLDKLAKHPQCVVLSGMAERIFQGFKTGADPVYVLNVGQGGEFFSKALGKAVRLEETLLKPLYKSGQLKRYCLESPTRAIIFPYKDGQLLGWNEIQQNQPLTAKYLTECRSILTARERGRWAGRAWYGFSRQQALQVMEKRKLLTADLNPHACFCFDETGSACFTGGAAGGYGITLEDENYFYLLGMLNSRVLDWFVRKTSTCFRGGWYSFEARYIGEAPIRIADMSNRADKTRHDRIASLVQRMLNLNKLLRAARTDHDQNLIRRQIAATDQEIDRLVYELYDLTDEEIAIVEGATFPQ